VIEILEFIDAAPTPESSSLFAFGEIFVSAELRIISSNPSAGSKNPRPAESSLLSLPPFSALSSLSSLATYCFVLNTLMTPNNISTFPTLVNISLFSRSPELAPISHRQHWLTFHLFHNHLKLAFSPIFLPIRHLTPSTVLGAAQ